MISSRINILLVDNYDSFTHNIAQYVRACHGTNLQIIEADDIIIEDIGSFDKIIFSPGPDLPRQGNIMEQILRLYSLNRSVLGICLGLQAIYLYYGGRLKQLEEVSHGRIRKIYKTGCYSRMLQHIPDTFEAGLYHSWIADPDFLPDEFEVTAQTDDGRIMGIRHKKLDIEAVQFHPESIMTRYGPLMIANWVNG